MAGKIHKMTDDMLEKLKLAFANSFTDVEAALYCWISPRTIYDYCSKNPDFAELKEALKKKPNIKAKLNWIKKINEQDYQASKEWLERKSRDEFSLKTETDNTTKIEIEGNISIKDAESMSEYERNELRKAIISWEKL